MEDNRVAVTYTSGLFDKIIPSFRHDGKENRDSWQKRAYDRLYSLLGLDRIVRPADSKFEILKELEVNEVKVKEFRFQSEEGYFVPGYIVLPKEWKGEKLSACICLQGHSSGMHNSILVNHDYTELDAECYRFITGGDRDFALRTVKEGYVAVCIEQRYMGKSGTFREKPGCTGLQSMAALLMGRCAVGERVWDVMRLIDELEKIDYIDTQNLVCMGNSGGGTTTFYSACIDTRIKYAMPSCAFCTYKDSIVDIRHCACNYIPNIAFDFDMGDLAGLIAPRNLVIVNGVADTIFPDFAVRKAFDTAKQMFDSFGGKTALVTGAEGHRFYADIGWEQLHKFEKENGITR